jgi:hypothetical protein
LAFVFTLSSEPGEMLDANQRVAVAALQAALHPIMEAMAAFTMADMTAAATPVVAGMAVVVATKPQNHF